MDFFLIEIVEFSWFLLMQKCFKIFENFETFLNNRKKNLIHSYSAITLTWRFIMEQQF